MSAAKDRLRGYNGGMVLRRTPHAVYDTLYHLVWSPKYRRDVLQGEVQQRVRELFVDIAEQYDITIEEMEVSPDHIHIFCSFPPRYSIAQVVTRFKSLSARAIFREFPRVKRRLWGGELWEDGYFARTVGDKVTAEVIRRYIQQHRLEKTGDAQLSLFEYVLSLKAPPLAAGLFYLHDDVNGYGSETHATFPFSEKPLDTTIVLCCTEKLCGRTHQRRMMLTH